MPILGLQQQQTEVGRIRLGVKTTAANGRVIPTKLDRLRFTSARRELIDRIAELYGGKVEPWQPPRGNQQWQVITNTAEVPVMVPQQDPAESQWYELWSAGGCQRRCDGQQEKISKQPCLCDPDARLCKMHTRLRVMLEDVPGLGAWRVDTGSYYAAVEMPGIAALLAQAQGVIPARLVLEQRSVIRQVDGKPQTMNYVVPALHVVEITPAQLVSGKVHEMIAARRAAAIDARAVAAIGSGPAVDYPGLIDAARTVEALYELHGRAKAAHNGEVPDDLMAAFEHRAAAIRAAEPAAASTPAVVDATVVEVGDELDELWQEILAASPWETADELEVKFCELVGHPSDEANADDMRRFLAAIEQAKAGVTS